MISSSIIAVGVLAESQKQRMYALYQESYNGISYKKFILDLGCKTDVLMLWNNLEIVGFSTLVHWLETTDEETYQIIFSGDTVVSLAYRTSGAWVLELTKYLLEYSDKQVSCRSYYLLLTKGWRTYRLMPLFFKKFLPCPKPLKNVDRETTRRLKKVIKHYGKRYGKRYDYITGVIKAKFNDERLKPNTDDSNPPARDSEYAEYFFKHNPGYFKGDNLICVAEVSRDNISEFITKLLHRAGVEL